MNKLTFSEHEMPKVSPTLEVKHPNEPKQYLHWEKALEWYKKNHNYDPTWKPIVENDLVVRYPYICNGCKRTYWFAPGETFSSGMPWSCYEYRLREDWTEEEPPELGTEWWTALWEEAVKRGSIKS